MGLFQQSEVQRTLGLFLGVLHYGFGIYAKRSIPAKVETVITTGNKFAMFIKDGSVPEDRS